jgi:flagellar biosynthetic protein FliQ
MNDTMIVDLARNAMVMAASLAAPMLLTALGIGLLVSIVQAVTQIQEQTLAFVPKLVAVAMVFLIGLPWMIQTAVKYTAEVLRMIPSLAR